MNRRHALTCTSLAWLLNVGGWIAIVDGRGGSSEYFFTARPGFILETATFLTTTVFALLLIWGTAALDRKPGWGRATWELLLVIGTCLGMVRLINYAGKPLFSGIDARRLSFIVILLITGLLTFGLLYCRMAFVKTAERLLVVVTPLMAINIVAVTWTSIRLACRTDYCDRAAASASTREGARTRLVWVTFDEMDQALAFEKRPAGLELPEFERLRKVSIVATNVKAPGTSTLWCIPSLTTGVKVRFARPTSSRSLELEFADGRPARNWRDVPNIFAAAHSLGVSTALIGWYHPYCRMFGDLLASCYCLPAEHLRRSVVADKLGLIPYLLPHLQFVFGPRSLFAPETLSARESRVSHQLHAEANAAIWKASLSVIADRRFDFVFIHVPLPHPPGVRVRGDTLAETNDYCYIGNFRLVDVLLGEWRRALEGAGLWNGSALIVTSDHSLRRFWGFIPFWIQAEESLINASGLDTVPLLVKLPGQNRAEEIVEPIGAELVYGLALGILRGELRDPDGVTRWLRASGAAGGPGEGATRPDPHPRSHPEDSEPAAPETETLGLDGLRGS